MDWNIVIGIIIGGIGGTLLAFLIPCTCNLIRRAEGRAEGTDRPLADFRKYVSKGIVQWHMFFVNSGDSVSEKTPTIGDFISFKINLVNGRPDLGIPEGGYDHQCEAAERASGKGLGSTKAKWNPFVIETSDNIMIPDGSGVCIATCQCNGRVLEAWVIKYALCIKEGGKFIFYPTDVRLLNLWTTKGDNVR